MKKTVLLIFVLFALAGLSFSSYYYYEPPIPLEDYTVWVSWDDTYCNCGTIDEILLDIELWDVSANQKIDWSYDVDITNESQPYEHTGSASIIWNCQDCYEVRISIEYHDSEGLCCDGANTKSCDGEELIGDGVPISADLD
jgi:hypothetical protein